MIFLLDVNALLALGYGLHDHNERVNRWVESLSPEDSLATCAITEIGFLRVLNQVSLYGVSIPEGRKMISALHSKKKRGVLFFADPHGAAELPDWVKTGRQTTDGHLLGLATANSAELATLDGGIPGAFLIP